jgi:hypothetical protein
MKHPFHPTTLNAAMLLLTITTLIFVRRSPWLFFWLLCGTLALDLIAWRIRPRADRSARLADWTSDRLCEGMLFSVFWFPWLLLFIINCVLTLFSFLKRETYILPLRYLFAAYFLLHTLLGVL